MRISNFRGDHTDTSAKTKVLLLLTSVFLAEISGESPPKLFIFIVEERFFLDQNIQKNSLFIYENRSTAAHLHEDVVCR